MRGTPRDAQGCCECYCVGDATWRMLLRVLLLVLLRVLLRVRRRRGYRLVGPAFRGMCVGATG